MKPNLSLLLGTLLLLPALNASTITYTSAQIYGPGPQVTYTEQVGIANAISPTPFRSETSSACATLSTAGCSLGSFTAALPTVEVPVGEYVTSATLNLYYTSQVSDSGMTLASATPIVAQQYASAAYAGTHAGSYAIVFGTAAGTVSESSLNGYNNALGIDYTSIVEASLADGIALSPISIGDTFTYGVSDFYSVRGGTNSFTTFNENFDLTSATVSATLTVNFAQAPEPAAFGLLAAGFAVLSLSLLRAKKRASNIAG